MNSEILMLICGRCSMRVRGLAREDVPERGIVCRCGARLLPTGLRGDTRSNATSLPACEYRGDSLGLVRCGCQGSATVFACSHPGNVAKRSVSTKKAGMRDQPEYSLENCRSCTLLVRQEPAGVPRWVSHADLLRDAAVLASLVPPEVSRVVGIARSGMIPASYIAAHLHLPLYSLDNSRRTITACGNGWRIHGAPEREGPWLVVDDTQMSGRSLQQARTVLRAVAPAAETLLAVVYRDPAAKPGVAPDFHAVDLPAPHYLEWNLFNSVFSAGLAVDFDGILCDDPSLEDCDEGPRYKRFLQTARPKYLPRKDAVPMICSGRLERWRPETEEWLRRWGINAKRLDLFGGSREMRDGSDLAIANHKADLYSAFAPHLGLKLFVESRPVQARLIAEYSRLPVLCPDAAKVWVPGKNL